jgi:site-specific recombinase XerD
MTTNVILQKKNSNDSFGYLNVFYFKSKEEKKKVSLKFRMEEKIFDKTFDKEFNRFRQTTLFDYKTLNKEIDKLFNNDTIFEDSGKEIEKSFLKYFSTQTSNQRKLTTKTNYQIGYNKLITYLNYIEKNDLLFSELTHEFLIKFRDYLKGNGLQNSTIKHYFTIYKTIMNNSIDGDNYYYVKNPFRNIELKVIDKPKRVIDDSDIKQLMNIPISDRLFLSSRMFLFSLFSNGMRYSDLILLKYDDIKHNNIEYTMLKTKKKMIIPLSYNIVKLLNDILDIPDHFKELKETWKNTEHNSGYGFESINYSYNELIQMIYDKMENTFIKKENYIRYKGYYTKPDDKELIMLIDYKDEVIRDITDIVRMKISKHIKTKDQNEIIFKNFIKSDIFNDYNKLTPMNENQHKKYMSCNRKYNQQLEKMCVKYELNINKISSHNSRHTFVNMLLDMDNINLNDVSLTLGHKRISTTQNYISNGFDFKKYKNITDEFSSKFSQF